VFDLPQNAAVMLFAFRRTSPQPLDSFGMPGCSTILGPGCASLLLGQNQQAKFRLPIPNNPNLVGMHFFNQAIVLDPGAGNPLGAVISDAAEGVIGHW